MSDRLFRVKGNRAIPVGKLAWSQITKGLKCDLFGR